jgi:hypothetical protein
MLALKTQKGRGCPATSSPIRRGSGIPRAISAFHLVIASGSKTAAVSPSSRTLVIHQVATATHLDAKRKGAARAPLVKSPALARKAASLFDDV